MYPRLKATGDVVINVLRNPFAPQFSPNADYRATVQENVTLGYQVLDIDANDSDNVSVNILLINTVNDWFIYRNFIENLDFTGRR